MPMALVPMLRSTTRADRETQIACSADSDSLLEALAASDERAALEVLRATPHPGAVAFRKDPVRGGYPIHLAMARNLQQVALELATPSRYANVMEQQDASGCEGLQAACC